MYDEAFENSLVYAAIAGRLWVQAEDMFDLLVKIDNGCLADEFGDSYEAIRLRQIIELYSDQFADGWDALWEEESARIKQRAIDAEAERLDSENEESRDEIARYENSIIDSQERR